MQQALHLHRKEVERGGQKTTSLCDVRRKKEEAGQKAEKSVQTCNDAKTATTWRWRCAAKAANEAGEQHNQNEDVQMELKGRPKA